MIKTKYGMILGEEKNDYIVYKGIPYAKPPVGKLRFKEPVEIDPWEGVLEATHFGNSAIQRIREKGSFYEKEFYGDSHFYMKMSEDCLYLNIWTPKEKMTQKLPVAIWIHGGAFLSGAGTEMEFDGAAYAKRNVILVTINYRLGVFGFLCHPLLSSSSTKQVSGNYGILDQVAALKWVHDNIAVFGGDPENVTVFGQSAGAMSLQTLVCSPLTKGMIQRAIMQSGGGYKNPLNRNLTMEEAYSTGRKIFAALEIDTSSTDAIEKLQSCTTDEIYKASQEVLAESFKQSKGLPFVPVVDGYVLMNEIDEILKTGNHLDISYMLGSNSEDMTIKPEDVHLPEYSALHQANVKFAEINEKKNHLANYVYYFKRQLPGDDAGAFHSAELWYMFGTMKRCWRPFTEADYKLSEEMLDYWCNFIKYGNPNGLEIGEWKAYKADAPYFKEFDI